MLADHWDTTAYLDPIHRLALGWVTPFWIEESGLYELIMQSRKPQAVEFKRWVRKDVLPAIFKDGAYIMGEEKVATAIVGTGSHSRPQGMIERPLYQPTG